MAYTGNPSGVVRDQVRLLVGDISTSTSGEYLADADYTWFIAATANTYTAAQLAANSLAMMFTAAAASAAGTGYVEKQVGDLTLKKADATRLAASYRALSGTLAQMAASGLTPSAGGITVSGKDTLELDTDRVKPRFRSGLFDNPGAVEPST